MSAKEIYNRLEYLSPGCLKKDVLRYAKANNISLESLKQLSDVQLLNLRMAQLHVLPNSQRRIGQQKKSYDQTCQRSAIGLKLFTLRSPDGYQDHSNIM